ncbi:MAG: hypothetical protein MUF79_10560 [Burkholderiales bacterium]|jgi:hypothetical protein|nr:hypothetical protein [Burkholderiales bacterium]
MKRVLLATFALLTLAAVGGAVWLYTSLDHVAKRAIEHFGSEALGVEVTVERVKLSPGSGRGEILALRIANPKGFRRPSVASVGRIEIELDPATLASDVIVIRRLEVSAPAIVYETAKSGANLDALKRAAARSAKESGAQSAGGTKANEKKLIVDRLAIRGAALTYAPTVVSGSADIRLGLPDIVMNDVGRRKGGLTPEELTSVIVNAVVVRTAQAIDPARLRGGVQGLLGL